MGKSTFSMAIFNRKLFVYQRIYSSQIFQIQFLPKCPTWVTYPHHVPIDGWCSHLKLPFLDLNTWLQSRSHTSNSRSYTALYLRLYPHYIYIYIYPTISHILIETNGIYWGYTGDTYKPGKIPMFSPFSYWAEVVHQTLEGLFGDRVGAFLGRSDPQMNPNATHTHTHVYIYIYIS